MGDAVLEYHIVTLNDILQLDQHQRVDFLKDLVSWLEFQDKIKPLISELENVGIDIQCDGMIWKDDNITGNTGLLINGERVL